MKVALHTRYGPPDELAIVERNTPVPADDQVRIKVRATTVSSGDCNARNLTFVHPSCRWLARLIFGIGRPWKPVVLGTQVAGDIDAVGAKVTRFKVGDPVFASTGAAVGGHAQYVCLREDRAIARKPPALSYEEAAAIPFGADVALTYLVDYGKLQAGHELLILGASGAIGTAAVQIGKHLGARVTGVCSGPNVELVRSLGADAVIDYTREDFTGNGKTYDRILDTFRVTTFKACKGSLKPDGIFLACLMSLSELLIGVPWSALTGGQNSQRLKGGVVIETPEKMARIAELAEAGVLTPVIDSRYPLERIADAFRRAETGHKRGSVVVTVAHEGE